MQKGNIFIFDAKKMEGLPVREYEGTPLHVTPGLCLFYVNAEKKLMPIAIQVFSWKWENSQILSLKYVTKRVPPVDVSNVQ